jgi:hypothetical protein
MSTRVINGFTYSLSDKPNKKLKVTVDSKVIHFGSSEYEHFFDQTKLLPTKLNHGDEKRRKAYLTRASKIKDKDGNLTVDNPTSANYHSVRVLWNG